MSWKRGFFVTGTDTGVGKTRVTVALLHWLAAQGVVAAGMKPVASGAAWQDGALRNADALALQAASGRGFPYELINPVVYEPPVAPHLAAEMAAQPIRLDPLLAAFSTLAAQVDCVLVEGVGGWMVPLNEEETTADLAVALRLPVIMVVAMRLGCLNHALLTAAAVERSGVALAGWVANVPDPDWDLLPQNLHALDYRLPVPRLGLLRHQPDSLPMFAPQDLDGDGLLRLL